MPTFCHLLATFPTLGHRISLLTGQSMRFHHEPWNLQSMRRQIWGANILPRSFIERSVIGTLALQLFDDHGSNEQCRLWNYICWLTYCNIADEFVWFCEIYSRLLISVPLFLVCRCCHRIGHEFAHNLTHVLIWQSFTQQFYKKALALPFVDNAIIE